MFRKVLIANRGAIACRVIRTLRKMGIGSVAVYSEADKHALHVAMADEAVLIGPAPAAQSYLSSERIFSAARQTGAEAIHPGYGFLSENADFAEACARERIVFIGPTPAQMRAFGLKHTARELAIANGVPLLPGSGLLSGFEEAAHEAERIGYPVMVKATSGGGGIGMRLCRNASQLRENFEAVERLGKANFKDGGIYLERLVEQARHIEVQIFGDGKGSVVALGERDCSAQRRNQKVIEETPAPGISVAVRAGLMNAAVRLARAVGYQSAGTVEFLYDSGRAEFYFLEVNTRLQVEHGVTEEVTGLDLVEWMVLQAAGELVLSQPEPRGHSIQARIYAEQPHKNFQPSSGVLSQVVLPGDVRVESGFETGSEVTPYYDPLLAKIIVKGVDRSDAVAKLQAALGTSRFDGIETNLDYLKTIAGTETFRAGGFPTAFLATVDYHPHAMEVVEPGTQTTVQDLPGRLGYWHVGVPPSGPFDGLAFRLANEIVGNAPDAAALECTLMGPELLFHSAVTIALTGADMQATLDGAAVACWEPVAVTAGSRLRTGAVVGAGARAYLAVSGGIDVPEYLGSKSTFILGKFGGHAGRTLRAGDLLRFGDRLLSRAAQKAQSDMVRVEYSNVWHVGVLYGPHGAPDFFTAEDIEMFFATDWKVHYNSDRTGVRLIGPKPQWARKDGGEAGLHPSNVHDNAYAVGSVDFTGDMPIILGPDGPSLGGFVCPATVVHDELWKVGQLKAGDVVRFKRVDNAPAILRVRGETVVRNSGDRNLLIEFGPNRLDFALRLRAHAVMDWFEKNRMPGIIDLTPGIRSLQIHYDSALVSREALLEALDTVPASAEEMVVPSRVVHLPLSWDDPATRLAIQKYTQSVRPDAPWCPSNIEFIRRVNGLESIEDVHRIVFDASYLVMGLGDVYLGAPVATPIDPRHRLVTTKYNPARTWTPENAVGIGGAYMCVYGMEGPGGYQFVGRTVQMWKTHRSTPWLLRFFDRIRFYPVSAEELLELRDRNFEPRIEDGTFRLSDSTGFDATEFKARQQAAFEAERERWIAAGQADYVSDSGTVEESADSDSVPAGMHAVRSPVTANVWKIVAALGQRVAAGDKLMILEAMKMEIVVTAPSAGEVQEIRCREGALVMAGTVLGVIA